MSTSMIINFLDANILWKVKASKWIEKRVKEENHGGEN